MRDSIKNDEIQQKAIQIQSLSQKIKETQRECESMISKQHHKNQEVESELCETRESFESLKRECDIHQKAEKKLTLKLGKSRNHRYEQSNAIQSHKSTISALETRVSVLEEVERLYGNLVKSYDVLEMQYNDLQSEKEVHDQ